MADLKKEILEMERENESYKKMIISLLGLLEPEETEDETLTDHFRSLKTELQLIRLIVGLLMENIPLPLTPLTPRLNPAAPNILFSLMYCLLMILLKDI